MPLSASMAEIQVTTGSQERVQYATDLLSKAFRVDPVITYLLSSLTAEQRDAYRPKFFHAILTNAGMNKASFEEVDGWKSCGVLMPPGSRFDQKTTAISAGFISVLWSIGLGGTRRVMLEMPRLTKACKAKCLREDDKYYYIFFLGTEESGRGRGLCSAIVRHYQSVAAREQLPIYLEAATEHCKGLYQKLGFQTVDEILLGKGKAAADGTARVNGPGVKIWGMIWRPEEERQMDRE